MTISIGVHPLQLRDGYLPIEDHGLIGDGAGAALVARDGTVSWLCVPRLDSDPVFCSLLDRNRGGHFLLRPEGLHSAGHAYLPDTGVLVTELHGPNGIVRITDAMALRPGSDLRDELDPSRGELLRKVEVVSGRVRLEVDVSPRGGASIERHGGAFRLRAARAPELDLTLGVSGPLESVRTAVELEAGEELIFSLRWSGRTHRRSLKDAQARLDDTVGVWRSWADRLSYEGPQRDAVRRSAITLKMLDHVANGAIVAAPTSSLPEHIGGERNWDYRFAWVRDAAFSVYALNRIGCPYEGHGFVAWILDVVEEGRPKVLYNLDGGVPAAEQIDPELEGYRGSGPVRWGNAAAHQTQHDVYGEIIDCAYQWSRAGGDINPELWEELRIMADAAAEKWDAPDRGIWEVRSAGRPFTYSAAMCHVAVDRAARLAETHGFNGDVERWRKTGDEIKRAIFERAWDEKAGSFVEHLGPGALDASILALPLRRVVDAKHPKMVATVEAVTSRLGAGNGLLFRYLPHESPDGLTSDEGAFLLCSFWLADNLALQGRVEEAAALFDSLCARANSLGLLPEQIDPANGEFLGNFPQALSHVGLISTGVNLARASKGSL
ncbi:MAG TPA: glycoside hydrolase family 15 protein [Actinomycetota bacterium]|nr:glycoside hydrolase family 15 protein [Actinomycetota bacterium]